MYNNVWYVDRYIEIDIYIFFNLLMRKIGKLKIYELSI